MKNILLGRKSSILFVSRTHRFTKLTGSFYAIFIFAASSLSFRVEGSSISPGPIICSLGWKIRRGWCLDVESLLKKK